jgi:hypothetical protein
MRTNQRAKRRVIGILFVFLALPLTTVMAQVTQSSMEQLAKESDAVVVGKVAGLSPEWNSTKTRIQTRVTIAVDQSVKGDPSLKSMTIVVPGGEVDGVGEVYSHAPRFLRDEDVVVFAKKSTSGTFQVANGNQGKFTIQKDDISGRMVVDGANTLEALTTKVKSALAVQELK